MRTTGTPSKNQVFTRIQETYMNGLSVLGRTGRQEREAVARPLAESQGRGEEHETEDGGDEGDEQHARFLSKQRSLRK